MAPDGVDGAAIMAKLGNRSGWYFPFLLVNGETPLHDDDGVRQAGALMLAAYFRGRGEAAGEKALAEEKKRKSRVEGVMWALCDLRSLSL